MGMAEGGLASLPVPDGMFDEPTNGGFDDGYAGGGLVAFAGGGPAKQMTDEEYLNYILRKESGGRNYDKYGKPLTSKAGAKYAMQVLPSTARSPGFGITPARDDSAEEYNRVGREYALALRNQFGDVGGAAAYNMGPGAYQQYKAGKRGMPGETQNYISGLGSLANAGGEGGDTREGGFPGERADILGLAGDFREALSTNAKPETKRRDEMMADIEAGLSPEAQKRAEDRDKNEVMLDFAMRLLGTNESNFATAIGKAGSETLPEYKKARTARAAMARADREALAALEGKSNEEKRQIEALALELAKAQAGLLSDERKMDLQYTIAQMDDSTKRAIAKMSTWADVYTSVFGKSMDYRTAQLNAGQRAEAARLKAESDAEDPFGGGSADTGTYLGSFQ
jgi:soluble lytic murein transglycosylase